MMEPHSQQSNPSNHPGDASTAVASNGGPNLTTTSAGTGDGGPPPQQQQQSTTLTTINSADFFSLDGMQYSVPRGYDDSSEDAYNVQQFYHDAGVFSCDDLYAVMDPSNPSDGVTEIDGSAANWQSTGFIPLGNSDIKQLEGVSASSTGGGDGGGSSTSVAGASGPYYRLITLTNEGAQVQAYPPDSNNDSLSSASSSEMTGGNGNGADSSAEYMASPGAGVMASAQDGSATATKVRKPRGRKPKHVKEAEAAAAAAQVASLPQGEATSSSGQVQGDAAGASGASPASRGSLEDIQRPSNSVTAQQTVPPLSPYHSHQHVGQIAGPSGSTTAAAVPRYPQASQSQHGQQQLSLERLAYQDRQAILMARRNQDNILRQQAHSQAPPHRTPPPSILVHHRPSFAPKSSIHHHIRIPAQPTAANSSTQQGRLDQFFSSRIAAPSNKSVVKPKIIQENRGIYNLLTAPTPPCNPPPPASFEKRWMQYPNPSILESENGPHQPANPPPSSSGSLSSKAFGDVAPAAVQGSRPTTNRPPPAPNSPYAAPSPRKLMDQNSSLFYIGGVAAGGTPSHQQARVNIRRGGDVGGADSLGFHSHSPLQRRPHPHDAGLGYYAAQQLYRSAGGEFPSSSSGGAYHHHNPSGYSTITEIEKLKSRIDDMTQIQWDLKYRVNQLTRLNKNLMMRIREVVDDNEDLRAYLRENREYSSGEGDYLGGRGSSGRYRMDYGCTDEGFDMMDNPWLYRRRSSVPRRMHRYPQETGGEGGKRRLDGLSTAGDEHGDSRKRACSEVGGGVMEREGDGKEVDKALLSNKANDERTVESGGVGVDASGRGISEDEVNMQKIKLELESSPPARGETVSPKSIKSVVTEFVTPTSEDGDNTMSSIFNSPLTVGTRAPASSSTVATGGKEKPCFQACDFATFKSFSNGCVADAGAGEEDGHETVMLMKNKVEDKHNDKSKEALKDDRQDKSFANDKIAEDAFIVNIKSEII